MYEKFYGLKRKPFSTTSDPHYFFESVSHREAYAAIQYGIMERKGLILITGEVGTGKTTLCKKLLDRLDKSVKTSLILNPYFSDMQLLQAIVQDFGIKIARKNRLDIINSLNAFLIELHAKDQNAVLIIDEAQHLSTKQLEQVRLLSNLETEEEKLLQVILMGQPELIDNLAKHNTRQIKQRIFVKYHLLPLKEDEVKDYIHLRLKDAGRSDLKFLDECYRIIYEFSGGIPRLINMLCDRALLMGYVREQPRLDETILRDSIKEIV
jgi:general secretion pathway protein A